MKEQKGDSGPLDPVTLCDLEQFGRRGNACLHDSCVTMQRSELTLSSPLKHCFCVDAGVAPQNPTPPPPVAPSKGPHWSILLDVVCGSFISIQLSQRSIFYFC